MTKKWWHDKVAYQIYPKSFYDSNGDGIGDLPGIISKLDYLQDLGVDIIWLSPCYPSPLADEGYDISDYYDIDPRFGTMEDMDRLLAEAKKRNMYILMDLVVNHCSDEHEWFKKACQDPEGKYGNFFYLRDKKEGELPTNWRSYFGGPVWEDLPGTNKQYLHVFHKKQPDLNWENPEVREEVYKNINWWLDKGLGGFRIDAIINIKKALPFRDYEPDREDGLCTIKAMLSEAKGIGEFLGEMRDRTFKKYDAFSVGEVFDEKPEEIPDFIGDNGYFSSMFDFNETIFGESDKGWYDMRQITPDDYKKCCFEAQAKVGDMGFLSNIIENHDEPRGVSRYIPEGDCCPESKKMLAALNFMLRGLPFIYQGQELGMENVSFSYLGVEKDLDGASFLLNKGETLGILGPTGSGKTTLVSLLLRLYDADGGVVWLGGRDVSTLSREDLRGRFGVVFQNEALLNDSVYENISFLRGLSREDVTAAAKTAQAWEFIEHLPEGLDAKLDIRGANLSGGQRQRLLVARALAARPNILILDSADSALDYRTAAALHAAIRRDFPGVTQVIISERVSSLRDADRILVLEDGVIAAQGTHQELLETCGRYRRMAELQMGGAV